MRPVGAQVVVDPADQRAGLGVRPTAGGRRHLFHPVEQVLFGAPQRLGIRTHGRHALGSGIDGRDLGSLFRLVFLVRVLRAIIVGVRGRGEQGCRLGRERIVAGGRRLAIAGREPLPLLAGRLAMARQRNGERLDRRQQLLLQPDHEQSGRGSGASRDVSEPGLPDAAVLVEQPRQHEFRRVVRQAVDDDRAHLPLREAALQFADVLLDAADHDVFQSALAAYRHATRKAVRVEQLQQGSEAVGVAVVRGGGQEESVLEAPAQIADGAGELGLDAVAPTARRRRVVGLVQDQQAARRQVSEPFAHGIGIGRVDEEVVRDQKPAVRAPRVDAEAPVPAHLRQVGTVQDHEQETETLLHLPLPLLQHGGGGGDDHGAYLLAQQQLAGDEAGLDGLAEAGVVGDEQVHPREAKRLAQRLHLVGVDLDAGPERRLKEVRIGGRDAVPAQSVQERAEVARRVETPGAEVGPRFLFQNSAVDFEVPVDLESLTLRIVVGAGQTHARRFARGRFDGFYQPAP